MHKGQLLRVQQQARAQRLDVGRGVQRVTQHGVANALQVYAQLVGAPCDGFELDQAGAETVTVAALQGTPAAAAGFAVGVNDVQRAALPVEQDRAVYGAPAVFVGHHGRLGLFWLPSDHRHVAFFDLAGFKQLAEAALGLNAPGHEQQARGVLVQAVDDQGFGVAVLHPFGQAVLLVRAATGHRQQAAGFFQHQQVLVFVDRGHAERAGRAERSAGKITCP